MGKGSDIMMIIESMIKISAIIFWISILLIFIIYGMIIYTITILRERIKLGGKKI